MLDFCETNLISFWFFSVGSFFKMLHLPVSINKGNGFNNIISLFYCDHSISTGKCNVMFWLFIDRFDHYESWKTRQYFHNFLLQLDISEEKFECILWGNSFSINCVSFSDETMSDKKICDLRYYLPLFLFFLWIAVVREFSLRFVRGISGEQSVELFHKFDYQILKIIWNVILIEVRCVRFLDICHKCPYDDTEIFGCLEATSLFWL